MRSEDDVVQTTGSGAVSDRHTACDTKIPWWSNEDTTISTGFKKCIEYVDFVLYLFLYA